MMNLPDEESEQSSLLAGIPALRRRLRALEENGDPAGVLDIAALAEAKQLWDEVWILEPMQVTVAVLIGRLHWHRYLLLSGSEDKQDLVSAGFLTQFVRDRTPHLLPELVAPLLQAAQSGSNNPKENPDRCAKIGVALLEQDLTEDSALLDRAVALLRPAAETAAGEPARQASALSNLGNALGARYLRTDDPADLEEAVSSLRWAVAITDKSDPNRPGHLSNLCGRLCARFERNGDAADLDEAIDVGSTADALISDEHPWRTAIERNLDVARRLRSAVEGGLTTSDVGVRELGDAGLEGLSLASKSAAPQTLDRTIHLLRMATSAADHPDAAEYLGGLGVALGVRYERQRQLSDLHEAVAACARALALTAPDEPVRPALLQNSANTLVLRYAATARPEDIDAAIDLLRELTALAPQHAMGWSNLGNALLIRYRFTGADEDLASAVSCGRWSVDLGQDTLSPADRAIQLSALSDSLRARFQRASDAADFDEALALARQAVETSPTADHRLLGDLADMLRVQFNRSGAISDLNEVIAVTRRIIDTGWPPGAGKWLTVLIYTLRTRFELTGASQDLDEAVAVGERALQRLGAGSVDRGLALAALGATYRQRWQRDGGRADPDRALVLGREAVGVVAAGDPQRSVVLTALANTLISRYADMHAIEDLNEAIGLEYAALAERPDQIMPTANLAVSLRMRFEHTGDLTDLDEAVRLGRAAITLSKTDRGLPRWWWTLGITLRTRFQHTRERDDADEAIALWQRTCHNQVTPIQIRIYAARDWARMAAALADWDAALAGYREAIHLLPLLAWRGIGRHDGEQSLATVAGLTGEAAAAAIAAGQLPEAVELLEHGRTVLWSQLLDTRSELAAVEAQAPHLASELSSIRAAIDNVDSPLTSDIAACLTGSGILAPATAPRVTDPGQRLALAARWNDLVARVRSLPGLADFLRPRCLADLLPPPGTGPVVIVNVSPWRCDALIVDHAGVRTTPLEGLSIADVENTTARYLAALRTYERQRTATARVRAEEVVTATLGWLWDTIASPVLAYLGHGAVPDGHPWPRVWWYPTAALHLLPISAAGHHDQPGQTVLDRVVSSYTPALRALNTARSTPAGDSGRPLLIVAMPETNGDSSLALPAVYRERDCIRSLLPPDAVTVLEGPQATRPAVYRALEQCAAAHFSCHGHQHPSHPSQSGVVLDDGTLTVTDIASAQGHGELAVLSACKTATTGFKDPDEAVHIASALHYTGWRHVVATLSSVRDTDATDITCDIYARITTHGRLDATNTAYALHNAQRAHRAKHTAEPSTWAPFIHIGP